jgi:hypothetical protein
MHCAFDQIAKLSQAWGLKYGFHWSSIRQPVQHRDSCHPQSFPTVSVTGALEAAMLGQVNGPVTNPLSQQQWYLLRACFVSWQKNKPCDPCFIA